MEAAVRSLQEAAQMLQFVVDLCKQLPGVGRVPAAAVLQVSAGTLDREFALVQEGPDFQYQFHVFAGVKALA